MLRHSTDNARPYRAFDLAAFFDAGEPRAEYVMAMLDDGTVRRAGLFEPAAVACLMRRCRSGRSIGVRESQALVGILSAQLWRRAFFKQPTSVAPLSFNGGQVLRGNSVPMLQRRMAETV